MTWAEKSTAMLALPKMGIYTVSSPNTRVNYTLLRIARKGRLKSCVPTYHGFHVVCDSVMVWLMGDEARSWLAFG